MIIDTDLQITDYLISVFVILGIYPKDSDTLSAYHACSKIWTSIIYSSIMCLKVGGWEANSVDFDEMLLSATSHLSLHCLLRPVGANTYGKL